MADIFMSYCVRDRSRAEVLVRMLTARGWSVFWDREILPGTDWESELEEQLSAARCIVVLWSEHASESRWVRSEMRLAVDRDVLVPVLIDDTKLPLRMREFQVARLEGPELSRPRDEVDKLMSALAHYVGGPEGPENSGEVEPPSDPGDELDFGLLGMP